MLSSHAIEKKIKTQGYYLDLYWWLKEGIEMNSEDFFLKSQLSSNIV